MTKPRDERQKDLFRPPLDQIIAMDHPLVRLAQTIDWDFIDQRFGAGYRQGPGHPPLPTRLVAGLFILKHMHNLSDEALCARSCATPAPVPAAARGRVPSRAIAAAGRTRVRPRSVP